MSPRLPHQAVAALDLHRLAGHAEYVVYVVLMVIGLYAVMARGNLVKKIIGLSIIQTAVYLFYIAIGRVTGGTIPVLWEEGPQPVIYDNALPHVLMLTAIVVGVSTTAVALALVVLVRRGYGSVNEAEILALEEAGEEEG